MDVNEIDTRFPRESFDVIISRIRTKLSKIDDSQTYIKSVRGIGYQLV